MPIDDLTALGQKMLEARKKKDLTQQELSDLSHVSVLGVSFLLFLQQLGILGSQLPDLG